MKDFLEGFPGMVGAALRAADSMALAQWEPVCHGIKLAKVVHLSGGKY